MKIPKLAFTGPNFINAIGAIIIAYLLIVLVQTVKHNYDLGQQINQLKSQISLLQTQKDTLADSIQYDQTASYDDRQARSQLGLQLPGEHVVIIPQSSSAPTAPTSNAAPATSTAPHSNVQQWLNFLTGTR